MKNIILSLLAVFFMSSGCEKEDILNLKDQTSSNDFFRSTFFDVDGDGHIDLHSSTHNTLMFDCGDKDNIEYSRIAVINSFEENTFLLRDKSCFFIGAAKPGDKIEKNPSSPDQEWVKYTAGLRFAYKHHYKDEYADRNPLQVWHLVEEIDENGVYVPVKISEGETTKIGWVKFKIKLQSGVAEIEERQFTTGSEIVIP